MSHVAAMLTNLLANRKHPSMLQSSKLFGDPAISPSDTRGHSESSAEQGSTGADDWEHGHEQGHGSRSGSSTSRSGSSTSRYSNFGHDLASHDEEDCDEGYDENAVLQRVMPSYSDGECFQDDEFSAIEYEDSDYHDNNTFNDDYEDGILDENTYSGRSVASPSKHYRGSVSGSGSRSRSRAGSRSGYSVSEEPYQCNSDGIFYRNERIPRSPSCTVSTGSTYLHCKERDRQLLAQMMESTTNSARKTPIIKAPFSVKPLQHPKRSCMVDIVLLSSRPCYGSPVRAVKSPNTIGLHDGSRPKFRDTSGFSIKNSKEEIYTRASLTLPRGKSKKTSRLICDDAAFQASDIYSSGQFGYLSKGRVSGHARGERDKEYINSKVQDSLRKEVRGLLLKHVVMLCCRCPLVGLSL
jgi:hypothetical protein